MKLDKHDLRFSVLRLPKSLQKIMQSSEWKNKIFVGGGFIRSVVLNEKINDIDVFVQNEKDAELLAYKLAQHKPNIHKTDNAYTVTDCHPTVQIIHRWVFEKPEDVSNSFDFTVCCAVIFYDDKWDSFCNDRFYIDLAGKRLIYLCPERNEDAGGSLLRVLKYYQKGFRIPLDSFGAVIARMIKDIDFTQLDSKNEESVGKVITGLLRVVDPNVDPTHEAHLPATTEEQIQISSNTDDLPG